MACALAIWLLAGSASAAVKRFAVIVGNNRGKAPDVELRYAESDAQKVAQVLRDLGGFQPAEVVLLQGENAQTVQNTLKSINERIRLAQARPGTDTMLFVYYSGHADGRGLRLGKTRLDFKKLAEFVRGSPAKVRLLVVDACRSGALTRVKGGRIVAPFELPSATLRGEGVAFLTASSQDEDAQESDELKGSFFTHALVSGMLGAADKNRDGQVVLEEAYNHAYDATLKATSGSFAGAQHPTFQYEVKGQGSLVLTRLAAVESQRARLVFPKGISFLVIRDDPEGPVVGEVGSGDDARGLSVRPGRFFVRGRGEDYLLEGQVSANAGETLSIAPSRLRRVAYARLVRKGSAQRELAHSPELGIAVRTPLPNASTVCLGGLLGYRLDLQSVSFTTRLGACTSSFENQALKARTNEYSLSLVASHAWDLDWLSLYAGLGMGTTLTHQSFDTRGKAPARLSLSPIGLIVLGANHSISERVYIAVDATLEGHLIRYQATAVADENLRTVAALRGSVVTGLQF